MGDNVVTNVGWISVPPNTVSNIQTFSMQSEPKKGAASEEVWIEPVDMELADDADQIEIAIAFEQRALYSPKLVHRKTQSGEYSEVTDAKYETQTDANGNDQTVALALFSLAQSCSLFGGSSSSHLLQLMNTALTMLVERRLKQAIHLVSSEHQNSPHIVKMSSIHIYSFLPCIFFYARKTYHPLLAIWRHVLFAFYIALLRIKPSHVFQPI